MVLFSLVEKLDLHWCYRCGAEITVETMSIDHKTPWLHDKKEKELFWDLENIAFSHLSCNAKESRGGIIQKRKPCPTLSAYDRGCRCKLCKELKSETGKAYYAKTKLANSNKNL